MRRYFAAADLSIARSIASPISIQSFKIFSADVKEAYKQSVVIQLEVLFFFCCSRLAVAKALRGYSSVFYTKQSNLKDSGFVRSKTNLFTSTKPSNS